MRTGRSWAGNRLGLIRKRHQYRLYSRRQARDARHPPVITGSKFGPPDFVGIGAQKCGTTWWLNLVLQHPDVDGPAGGAKEINFFEPYWQQPFGPDDRALYHRHFPVQPGRIRGEWTPEYLFDPWAVDCLSQAAPDARLVVILRDPVERYCSGLTHRGIQYGVDVTGARQSFQRGLYAAQLRRVLNFFPRDQLLVLQYERCCSDPAGQLAQTFAHLGLADHPLRPQDLSRTYNATAGRKIELKPEVAAWLRRAYEPNSRELAREFPEIDLDLWPSWNN